MGFIVSEYGLFALAVFAGAAAMIIYPLFLSHMQPVASSYVRVITGISAVEQDASTEPTLPDGNPAHD